MPGAISQGTIVWVAVPDLQGGNAKRRPAVVVSSDGESAVDGFIRVAAITTLTGRAPFAETVVIPHAPNGHPIARLKRASEVVCSWVLKVAIEEVEDSGGRVSRDELNEILAKVERLA